MLNVLLVGIGGLSVLALAGALIVDAVDAIGGVSLNRVYIAVLANMVGTALFYYLNQKGFHKFAPIGFLAVLSATLIGGHEPFDVVWGRGLFYLTIPILISSVILRPQAGFYVAAVLSLALVVLTGFFDFGHNPTAFAGLFTVALVSWVTTRSMEKALSELRIINEELDGIVAERTRDLTVALAQQRSEASKNQAILASIADGVVVFDTDMNAVVSNPSIRSVLGLAPERLIGRHISDLMAGNVNKADQGHITSSLKSPGLSTQSMQIEWMDRTLSISFAPITSTEEVVSGTVAVIRDYTREAEIDRMKSDFVSIASHELKTPLTAIQGYLDLLALTGKTNLSEKQVSYLTSLKENMNRLKLLVEDLLDISRIESGQLRLQLDWINLSELLESTVHDMSPDFEQKRLEVRLDLPEALPRIRADRHRLIQIMVNLLSNACKYTTEGEVHVHAQALGRRVRIDVEDTGLGIDSKDREKLFSRFYRASDMAVRTQPGTGLGLNITHSLVELHGGEIAVESQLGVGSKFSIFLPVNGASRRV